MRRMIMMTVEEARGGWGDLISAVTGGDGDDAVTGDGGGEHVRITRTRGNPADRAAAAKTLAIMVPIDWYENSPAGRPPAKGGVQTMTSSAVRAKLRDRLEAAVKGVCTKVTIYGKAIAVLVPPDWYAQQIAPTAPPNPS
jgi:hypothetical protein